MVLATLGEIAATAPASFIAGLLVGFVLSSRYRIVRKRSDEKEDP